MSLADDLANVRARKARPCTTATWLAAQDEQANINFRNALADGVHMSDLYRICVKSGLDAGVTQFKDHCQRRCCCTRGSATV